MFKSLRGHFLVASNHLKDSNFYRAVVLMLEHTEESAMGIVVNRPSSIAVDAAMTQLNQIPVSTEPIFAGGPVDTSALFILHNCSEFGKDDEQITPGVFVTGSNDSFESLLSKDSTCNHDCHFRVYCGYAGWGPLQLDDELNRGDWRTLPAEGTIVFEFDPYNIWERCTEQLNQQNRLLPHNVENPEWN